MPVQHHCLNSWLILRRWIGSVQSICICWNCEVYCWARNTVKLVEVSKSPKVGSDLPAYIFFSMIPQTWLLDWFFRWKVECIGMSWAKMTGFYWELLFIRFFLSSGEEYHVVFHSCSFPLSHQHHPDLCLKVLARFLRDILKHQSKACPRNIGKTWPFLHVSACFFCLPNHWLHRWFVFRTCNCQDVPVIKQAAPGLTGGRLRLMKGLEGIGFLPSWSFCPIRVGWFTKQYTSYRI